MTNLVVSSKLGCISRGWEWQIPRDYFGFTLPQDIATNLSRVALTSAVGMFSLSHSPHLLSAFFMSCGYLAALRGNVCSQRFS